MLWDTIGRTRTMQTMLFINSRFFSSCWNNCLHLLISNKKKSQGSNRIDFVLSRLLFTFLRQNARITFWDNHEINIKREKENKSPSCHVYAHVLCFNVFPGLRSWFKAVVVKPPPSYTTTPPLVACYAAIFRFRSYTAMKYSRKDRSCRDPPESSSRRWIIQ